MSGQSLPKNRNKLNTGKESEKEGERKREKKRRRKTDIKTCLN